MDLSDIAQVLAVLVECAVAGIAVLIATWNKKVYGWFIAATFALFVLFDITRIFAFDLSPDIHAMVFFIACALMLCGTWLLFKDK